MQASPLPEPTRETWREQRCLAATLLHEILVFTIELFSISCAAHNRRFQPPPVSESAAAAGGSRGILSRCEAWSRRMSPPSALGAPPVVGYAAAQSGFLATIRTIRDRPSRSAL